MATFTNVSGQLFFSSSFGEALSTGLISPYAIPELYNETENYTNGTGAGQIDLWYPQKVVLAATTMTMDFTSLTDPSGTAINFARIREGLIWIIDKTLANKLIIEPGASNGWSFAPNQTLFPGGSVYRLIADPTSVGSGIGAVIGSSSKTLKFDAGANTVTFGMLWLGCSALS